MEDCEFAKTAALKARQSADADLSEVQNSLDDVQRARKEAEDRGSRLLKEKTELQTQVKLRVETSSQLMLRSTTEITCSDVATALLHGEAFPDHILLVSVGGRRGTSC